MPQTRQAENTALPQFAAFQPLARYGFDMDIESLDDELTLRITRHDAALLARLLQWGLRAAEAFNLVAKIAASDRAVAAFSRAVNDAEVTPKRAVDNSVDN